jgi:hypothetical protein
VNATAKQQLSRNPQNAGYSTPIKTYPVPAVTNEDGTISVPAQAVYLINPNVEPIPLFGQVQLTDGTTNMQVIAGYGPGSGLGASNSIPVASLMTVANSSVPGWRPLQTPTVWRTLGLTTAAGATIIWPAVATKKHYIQGITIDIAAGTTAAAACVLTIVDNATTIYSCTISGGALAASAGRNLINVQFPSNGYPQIAANTDISINLSSVLAAGGVTANMWGWED